MFNYLYYLLDWITPDRWDIIHQLAASCSLRTAYRRGLQAARGCDVGGRIARLGNLLAFRSRHRPVRCDESAGDGRTLAHPSHRCPFTCISDAPAARDERPDARVAEAPPRFLTADHRRSPFACLTETQNTLHAGQDVSQTGTFVFQAEPNAASQQSFASSDTFAHNNNKIDPATKTSVHVEPKPSDAQTTRSSSNDSDTNAGSGRNSSSFMETLMAGQLRPNASGEEALLAFKTRPNAYKMAKQNATLARHASQPSRVGVENSFDANRNSSRSASDAVPCRSDTWNAATTGLEERRVENKLHRHEARMRFLDERRDNGLHTPATVGIGSESERDSTLPDGGVIVSASEDRGPVDTSSVDRSASGGNCPNGSNDASGFDQSAGSENGPKDPSRLDGSAGGGNGSNDAS